MEKNKQYDKEEAMEIVLHNAKAKFDETIELHCKLGVDQGMPTNKSEA